MRKVLWWGTGLIGLYLVLVNYTGFSKDEAAAASGSTSLIKAFQGR
jgi:hypothetical protein